MVIGIDVYHERGNRSVAGFVASMNRSLTRWFSRAVFQTQREELVTGLGECMNQALSNYHKVRSAVRVVRVVRVRSMWGMLAETHSAYYFCACCSTKTNGQLPEKIIVFRDGVGEGQMKYLLEMEVPQMIDCFKKFGQFLRFE